MEKPSDEKVESLGKRGQCRELGSNLVMTYAKTRAFLTALFLLVCFLTSACSDVARMVSIKKGQVVKIRIYDQHGGGEIYLDDAFQKKRSGAIERVQGGRKSVIKINSEIVSAGVDSLVISIELICIDSKEGPFRRVVGVKLGEKRVVGQYCGQEIEVEFN